MSNFIEVIAIVEGKTEQVFIERVLRPYLASKNIFISATQVSKPGQKGGDVKFSRVSQDIGNHLKQRSDTFVTVFVDYYGIKEWPALDELNERHTPQQIAQLLCQATREQVLSLFGAQQPDQRFIPYMAMHEFEALLFSDCQILAQSLGIEEDEVQSVLIECGEPEAINNGRETAPSKRLDNWSTRKKFAKTTQGISIAEKIGISKMRQACPLFDGWLKLMEAKLN